ncbi:MAG TPA: transcriptional regulator [Acidobacteria bacterium]|nr:transcriptional regulator [Acidobacteriota bacterium]
MPIYEYECLSCGKRTERLEKMDGPPLAACPACGAEVKKLMSAPAVQFKGSGWYVTDYAGKGKSSATKLPDAKGESGGEAKSETKPETKSESKTETKSEGKSSSSGSA